MENSILFMFKNFHKPRTNFKAHNHTYHEIIYFIKGAGQTKVGEDIFPYKPGDICFTPKGIYRNQRAEKRSEYLCLGFLCDKKISLGSGVYACEQDGSILKLLLDILEEYTQKKARYKEVCDHKISELLIKISRLQQKDGDETSMWSIIREIDNNQVFNISIEELAEKSSYSYDHFRHVFKKLTGRSPMQYVMQKRLEQAKKLLKEDNYSCTLVSQVCGFSTPAQFSAVFKRETGMTPIEYKEHAIG
ncbi:MAG: AraC family transcriptional regulator [Clostridia bacterium]|nr:AraC family transcriptional regulator [Clostridia bacterium]